MKFYIKHIILWLKNGKQRILNFENNKVNIITGKQSSGKSTIIEIIDYCFFSSSKNMPEGEIIDDNVEWYGINFIINNSHLTIARHQDITSKKYYFSSDGTIPQNPIDNFKENNLRTIIEKEFSINDNIVFPYGGKEISKNSKISPRYFMLFNTQRRDTLSHKDTLFDKQSGAKNLRYIEALQRIFDIALGISTIENLIKIEKLKEKEKDLVKLQSKQDNYLKQENLFESEISNLCEKAKQLKLIDLKANNKICVKTLAKQIENLQVGFSNNENLLDIYTKDKLLIQLKISKFRNYETKYKEYKELIKNDFESLKPIIYLKENFKELLDDNILDEIIINLSKELQTTKQYINSKNNPVSVELKERISELNNKLKEINEKISNLDDDTKIENLTHSKQLMFLGEVKTKLALYASDKEKINYEIQISTLSKEIENLKNNIDEIDRSKVISLLNDLMFEIFTENDFELGGYEDYKPFFDIKTKLIFLRKLDTYIKQSELIENKLVKNIGSSSNHLFLHLAFFNAIHRLFEKQKIPFIPQFLILDQPDSPYYSTGDNKEKEIFFKALKILDNQIEYFNNDLKKDFQIIVLEHIEWKELKEGDFKHYHLVDEWREEGTGLIPEYLLK